MITKVFLEGFKCYSAHTEFPLSKVNVLTGLNGRGKSTLIQSILSVSQSLTQSGITEIQLDGELVNLGDYEDVLARDSQEDSITMGFQTDEAIDKELVFTLRKSAINNRQALFSSLLIDGEDRVTEMGLLTKDYEPVLDNEGKEINVRELGSTSDIVSWRNFRNASYVSADRRGPVNRMKYVPFKDKPRVDVHGENLLNVLQAMNEVQRESVRMAMSKILKGGSLQIVKDNDEVVLSLDSNDSGQLFKPVNVGFGYGYILSTLVALELAEERSLFVIENPEAHLHPGAQATLTEYLLEIAEQKSLQLIIETHSDHIINTCLVGLKKGQLSPSDCSLLFFNRENNKTCNVVRLVVTDQGRVLNAPEDFFDQIDKSLEFLVGF